MCGICGIAARTDGPPVAPELLAAMCRTIVHRGPDDEGIHIEPGIGLGTRRLSIIDLAGGHQPLANEDGTIWASYNGEIYNFPDLKKELEGWGHWFQTRSDTETLVHGYEQWGDAFVERLRGMFAAAIWDRRRRRLVIIRDRLGIKPLYYTLLDDGTLVYGSELKAVIVHPGVKREIEPKALDLFLTLEYVPAPWSIFKGVFKLPAGHRLVYSNGTVRVESYWDLEGGKENARRVRKKDLPGVMDELYALLKESVKLRLLSDVPLGAFLSGGIDSATIVGLMRELGASPLKTFSIGFADKSYNELGHARRIARLFETEHEEFIIEPKALDLADTLVRHLDEPFGDFSIFPTYLVSKMARAHVTVILSGDGGDEVFGGYETYQAQKLSRLPLARTFGKTAGRLIRPLPPSAAKKGTWNKLRRFVQAFDHPAALRHLRWMMFLTSRDKSGLYSGELVRSLGGIPGIGGLEPFASVFGRLGDFDPMNGELYLDLKTYLADDILVKVDRMSMAPSLEARVPLLDHKLVEFVFSLPGDLKVRGLETKWLFKKTMERLLPAETIYRKKEGFSIPIKHWLREDLRDMVRTYLDEKRLGEEGLFNPPPVQAMIKAHMDGRENYSHQLWSLLVFEIWKDNYLPKV
jgi:asparagine synthase (glutamine-hydrolysing)